MLYHVALAIPDELLRTALKRSLQSPEMLVHCFSGSDRAWERLIRKNADFIVIHRELIPPPVVQSITYLRQLPDRPSVIVLADQDNDEERARLVTAGCEAVLHTLLPIHSLQSTLRAIVEHKQTTRESELAVPRGMGPARLHDFISHSAAMRTFMNVVARVVSSEAPLLIQGETGGGKERLARAIHTEGSRSAGPFVAVNCGALPEALLESELFGHEEGAFTGATRYRRGCFELAHRGTIFLDEIGEMPLHLQVRLLRVLQEYEVQPIGSEKSIQIHVRVMASTNRNLEEEVKAGRFRRDLYYRMSVVSLTIPPLRERKEDIPALVESYINFLRPRIGPGSYEVRPEVLQALSDYNWPGNVRELINVIERAMLLCSRQEITLADLPDTVRGSSVLLPANPDNSRVPAFFHFSEEPGKNKWRTVRRKIIEHYEREYLAGVLRQSRGRIDEAARQAGIGPRALFDKMKKYQLRKEDFKSPTAPLD